MSMMLTMIVLFKKIKRNYGRKRRRVVFSDAEDEGALSSEEEVERVAKKRKKPEKPDVVNVSFFERYFSTFDSKLIFPFRHMSSRNLCAQ